MMHPALLWWQLGLRTWEMLLASSHVIGVRTARMAQAGTSPNARDRREFTRMGTEKVQAAQRSALAMATQMQGAMWGSWLKTLQAGLAPIHSAATANSRRLARIDSTLVLGSSRRRR
jgi:hypothetical protein